VQKLLSSIALLCVIQLHVFGLQQGAAITRFESISSTENGAAVCTFSGSVYFEHSIDEFNKTGDNTEKIYVLVIKFKENGKLVTVNTGFATQFADEDGSFYLQKTQKLSMAGVNTYYFTFTVPIALFSLKEGKHTLTPVISLVEKETLHSVLRKEKTPSVTVTVLPIMKFRLWVKHILVDSLDAQGNLWDYYVLNPVESNPDLVWSLKYAGRTYFSSKMLLNTFEYNDKNQQETYDLTMSKGDTISIEVKDVDDLTPDDIIGTVLLSPSDSKHQNSAIITAKAGQVKTLEYTIVELH